MCTRLLAGAAYAPKQAYFEIIGVVPDVTGNSEVSRIISE
jgi:hypothetical protein